MEHKGKKLGKYILIKEIGRGQFGTVYVAESEEDQKQYAVKVVQKSLIDGNTMLKKLQKAEVGVMNNINHPNIMHLFDFLESENNYYLIMQFCNNGDLEQYMINKKKKFFGEEESIYFLKQIMVGFQEQHKNKIMHRDFKQANQFVHDDTLIIGDFGFAKSGFEMAQTKLGTPLTMAPELLNDSGKYTSKADLWGIGVVFYQLLFGDPPFFALSIGEQSGKIAKGAGKNLNIPYKKNQISEPAVDLLKRLLEDNPDNRISWHDFFCHKVFEDQTKEDEKKKQGQFLGNFLIKNASKMNVDKNFEQIILEGKYDTNEVVNPLQQDIQKDTNKINEELVPLSNVNNIDNKLMSQEVFRENAFRYFHEKNKILFIFQTVKQLRQAMKNEIYNEHAPSIYVLMLCLAKKGIILSELNVMSLKKGNNIFKLSQFEEFTKTENCSMAIRSQLEDQPSLFEYFNYQKNKTNEVRITQQDINIIQKQNTPYIYIPTLDQMCQTKFEEFRAIPEPSQQENDPSQKHEFYLMQVYSQYAIDSEPNFAYSENGKKFEWETFKQKHEAMSDPELKDLINKLTSGELHNGLE